MIINAMMNFEKDLAARQITVSREFEAPVALVWKAWTDAHLLDQWWAPKPYEARTKTLDFREGGYWLYSMNGPDGSQSWVKAEFQAIITETMFTATNFFCNENGERDPAFPYMHWETSFEQAGTATRVQVIIRYDSEADMKMILELGFEEGFIAALGNLDEMLATQVNQ